jgi:3'(2'),5'-bisphosphate nucleotidase
MRENIIQIAEKAGEILLKYFKTDLSVEYKNDDDFDLVTMADKESDEFIRSRLSELFPGDLILSEENDSVPTDYSKRIWMVDPLDGTRSFVNEEDGFSILIGLWSDDSILFGLAYAPARKKMYFAEKGKGAFERKLNGEFKKIVASDVKDLSQVRMITKSPGGGERPLDELLSRFEVKKIIEDSGIKVSRIAAGEIDLHINTNFRASKWDTLATQLILEEAGGAMTDLDGHPLNYKQSQSKWGRSYIAASNRGLLELVLDKIKIVDNKS